MRGLRWMVLGLTAGSGLGCAGLGERCPAGTEAREDVLDGNLTVHWCGTNDKNDPIGPVEYRRGGATAVRGALDEEGRRVGEWTLFDDHGAAIGGGSYDDGVPNGTWRFPDGIERRWREDQERFEPDGPFALILDRQLGGGLGDPADSRFELIDADLARGRIAYRAVWTANANDRDEPPPPCAYPGLDPLAGVRLGVLEPGALRPRAIWDVYRPSGFESCSSEAEAKAALDAAKAGFAADGLDPTRKGAIEHGSGSEVPWHATVGEHKLWFDKQDEPSLPWELRVPALVGRAGVDDSINGRTTYYELRVDSRPSVRFAFADSGSNAIAMLSVGGMIVDGDRASLVVEVNRGPSGSCCFTRHEVATPVISLSKPLDPW